MRYSANYITLSSIPQPTGPYQVGTCQCRLIDENRKEVYYPNGRLIPIQIYFPTTKGMHRLYPKRLEKHSPQVFSQVFYYVHSSDSELSNITNKQNPIVFLNHGLTAAMTDYSAIAEDLASNGYIVIAIQHQLNTDADPADEPPFWKTHSLALQARVIDNIMHVFEWLQINQTTLFKNRIDCKRIGFIGHSLGSNSLLLLACRRSGFLKGQPVKTLLPHKDDQDVKECIISLDFDVSFAYPRDTKYPMFFIFSEERQELLKDLGIFEDIVSIGHKAIFITPSKHISFFDQGYIDPKDPAFPNLIYFSGSEEERKAFFNNLRKSIREYLDEKLANIKGS